MPDVSPQVRNHEEIGNLLPNNQRQRRTCYAVCHILYTVSAAHTSIFRMDSNSTFYYRAHKEPHPHPPLQQSIASGPTAVLRGSLATRSEVPPYRGTSPIRERPPP